jgi:hypothetical protein
MKPPMETSILFGCRSDIAYTPCSLGNVIAVILKEPLAGTASHHDGAKTGPNWQRGPRRSVSGCAHLSGLPIRVRRKGLFLSATAYFDRMGQNLGSTIAPSGLPVRGGNLACSSGRKGNTCSDVPSDIAQVSSTNCRPSPHG